jgi:hypothetical protein
VHIVQYRLYGIDDNGGSHSSVRQHLAEQHANNDNAGIELMLLSKHIYYRRFGASNAHSSKQIDGNEWIAEVDVTQVGTVTTVTVQLLIGICMHANSGLLFVNY